MSKRPKQATFAERCLDNHKVVLARQIRKISKENGWNSIQLAENSGVATSTAWRVLTSDDGSLNLDTLIKMSYGLGMTVSIVAANPNI